MYDWLPSNSQEIVSKLVAKAWKDPKFKKRLMTDPKSVLKEMGIKVPADVKFTVIENTNKDITLVLPPENKNIEELSEEEMNQVAGGSGSWSGSECCPFTTHC